MLKQKAFEWRMVLKWLGDERESEFRVVTRVTRQVGLEITFYYHNLSPPKKPLIALVERKSSAYKTQYIQGQSTTEVKK